MNRLNTLFLFVISSLSLPVLSATVVYTDSQHPPSSFSTEHQVVYLDAPDTAQQELFGSLSVDPNQAEQQAKAILHSPEWQQKQQHIIKAYQGVLEAYRLGLKKYPAVVFDEHYVVYGTSDLVLAESKLAEFKGAQ